MGSCSRKKTSQKHRHVGKQALSKPPSVHPRVAQVAAALEANTDSPLKDSKFCCRSSLGVPFLVVSNQPFVTGVPVPSREEWIELLVFTNALVKQWETPGCVLLADFEGEGMGVEGELVSAAFQRTWAIERTGLRPMKMSGRTSEEMGLMFDFRCLEAVAIVKRIMEAPVLCKAIWGADGDISALRYTPPVKPLGIKSLNVLDVQLAYSEPKRRLAMSKMLPLLPPKVLKGLPDKSSAGGADFSSAHSQHRRAIALPMSIAMARYSTDDLHRLEKVLLHRIPAGSNFTDASRQTGTLTLKLLASPFMYGGHRLRLYSRMLQTKTGLDRQSTAVRLERLMIALRRLTSAEEVQEAVKAADLAVKGAEAQDNCKGLEERVREILEEAGVSVPDDLEFAPFADSSMGKDVKEDVESQAGGKTKRAKILKMRSKQRMTMLRGCSQQENDDHAENEEATGLEEAGADPDVREGEDQEEAPRKKRTKRRKTECVDEDAEADEVEESAGHVLEEAAEPEAALDSPEDSARASRRKPKKGSKDARVAEVDAEEAEYLVEEGVSTNEAKEKARRKKKLKQDDDELAPRTDGITDTLEEEWQTVRRSKKDKRERRASRDNEE